MSYYCFPHPRFLSLLGLVLSLYGFPAGATTFTVTNLNDSGPGSLRQAILDTNATADDDTIVFQSGLSGTITLTSGELAISSDLTIDGLEATVLAISGNHTSRIFTINFGTTVIIEGLTIKEGQPAGNGGGILNNGTLNVSNSILSGNSADSGGGIFNNEGAILTMSNSTIDGLKLDHLNAGAGGGIANTAGGTLTVINSTVSNNWAVDGGGIDNAGTATVRNSSISGNKGIGGIFNSGTLMVINSTLSGNFTIWGGGGILNTNGPNHSTLTVINSTITGNTASDGGGITNFAGNILILGNSIVAGNTAPMGKEINNFGVFTSQGHNLFGENGASEVEGGTLATSDIVPTVGISAILAPLGNYGGPTQTHLLVPGSPAINAGDNALIPASVTTDQRGFPRIQAGTVDIGAVEVGEAGATDIPTLSQWAALGLVALLLGLSGWWLRRRKPF